MDDARGRRILIVEDEPILAIALQDILEGLGYDVVGPAFRVEAAMLLARDSLLDGAILDVNMGDGDSYEIAACLAGRAIPYLFATGYGREGLEAGHEAAPVLAKPYREKEVADAVAELVAAPPPSVRQD